MSQDDKDTFIVINAMSSSKWWLPCSSNEIMDWICWMKHGRHPVIDQNSFSADNIMAAPFTRPQLPKSQSSLDFQPDIATIKRKKSQSIAEEMNPTAYV